MFKNTEKWIYAGVQGADVKTQAAINFLNATTILIFSKTSLRAPGQHVLMSMEIQPSCAKCRSSYIEVKLQCGLALGQPCPMICVSNVKSCGESVILHMFAEFFCAICVSAVGNHAVVCLCKNTHR